MRAKAPCHRVRNPQGCGCDYCGPNTPTQPTSAPEVEVPLAPRQGRGTRRNSSIHEGRDATGNLLYGGVITDSTRKELKLQQQRNLERKHTSQDKKRPKLEGKGGAVDDDGDGGVESTAEARSPSLASLESSLRMGLLQRPNKRRADEADMGMGSAGKTTKAADLGKAKSVAIKTLTQELKAHFDAQQEGSSSGQACGEKAQVGSEEQLLSQEVMKGLEEEIDRKNRLIVMLVQQLDEHHHEIGQLKETAVEVTLNHARELRSLQQRLALSEAQHRLAQNAIAKHRTTIVRLQKAVGRCNLREPALKSGITKEGVVYTIYIQGTEHKHQRQLPNQTHTRIRSFPTGIPNPSSKYNFGVIFKKKLLCHKHGRSAAAKRFLTHGHYSTPV